MPEGICIDVVPVGEQKYAVRPYGMEDLFKGGEIGSPATLWMGRPVTQWLNERGGMDITVLQGGTGDIQHCRLFPPCMESLQKMEMVLKWMIGTDGADDEEDKYGWTHKSYLRTN